MGRDRQRVEDRTMVRVRVRVLDMRGEGKG